MDHLVKISSVVTVVVWTSLVSVGTFADSIINTRHNLGSTGLGPNTVSPEDTAEVCIFCHTPHGGDTAAPVPLWNKNLSNPGIFTTYDQLGTSTLDAAVGSVGSVSLACLTCHDGTQAIDNIINAPGSGGFDASGGGANGLNWTWTSDGTLTVQGAFTGSVDIVPGVNIWQIGTDLTNDHPVSMQYGGGGYSVSNPNGGAFGISTRDKDFAPAIPIGTAGRWYVDNTVVGTGGVFDKWDFKLYTRDTSGFSDNPNNGAAFANEKEPFVECGSCHDPHFETTTFLRMPGTVDTTTGLNGGVSSVAGSEQSNRNSRVCLTCHTK